jgi:hypothetical protein
MSHIKLTEVMNEEDREKFNVFNRKAAVAHPQQQQQPIVPQGKSMSLSQCSPTPKEAKKLVNAILKNIYASGEEDEDSDDDEEDSEEEEDDDEEDDEDSQDKEVGSEDLFYKQSIEEYFTVKSQFTKNQTNLHRDAQIIRKRVVQCSASSTNLLTQQTTYQKKLDDVVAQRETFDMLQKMKPPPFVPTNLPQRLMDSFIGSGGVGTTYTPVDKKMVVSFLSKSNINVSVLEDRVMNGLVLLTGVVDNYNVIMGCIPEKKSTVFYIVTLV